MKKFALIVAFCMLFACGCDRQKNELKQTIKTGFGDELHIHVYLSGNYLHETYLTCKITNEQLEGFGYFYDREITQIPSDVTSNFWEIVNSGDTRVYKLFNEFIVIHGERLDNFSDSYDLEKFTSDQKMNMDLETIYFGIKSLCSTRKFEYIKQFAYILAYCDNEFIISIISPWASGCFSQEELAINQGYTKEYITQWCVSFLNDTNQNTVS